MLECMRDIFLKKICLSEKPYFIPVLENTKVKVYPQIGYFVL